ncbi:acetylxylan esterase [Microbacterium schleiferi]|uniref:Acetylxylan esterase n=1 Tax=Microbacterium schleiferi TaxID=69362 RepID=A0ABU7V494_9MICO
MARFDLSEDDLRVYLPTVRVEGDFDAFWKRTIAEARATGGDVRTTPVSTRLQGVEVYDLNFPGFAGEPIRAWYLRPRDRDEPLPTIVEYIGYGGGRGLPHDHLAWVTAGYAHVVMDTRGQGSSWASGGVTSDPHGTGPSVPGFMTRGIEDPDTYYYRRLITDAVRCADAARGLPGVDPGQLVVTGVSQGGGLALAVAGLHPDLAAAMIDVPFLCHFERAVGLSDRDPYAEVARYLAKHRSQREVTFRTLSYFDGVNFAARATAPALFSTALHDATCPPSTVFAAFNAYAGLKEMTVFPFNDHEGGGASRWPSLVAFADRALRQHPRRPPAAVH